MLRSSWPENLVLRGLLRLGVLAACCGIAAAVLRGAWIFVIGTVSAVVVLEVVERLVKARA